jgi:hypothetical protein
VSKGLWCDTCKRPINEQGNRQRAAEKRLLNELCEALRPYRGETGRDMGFVATLERLLSELTAKRQGRDGAGEGPDAL